MNGHLAVVGLGPGDARWLTPEADAVLAQADALYGYLAYLDRVPVRPGPAIPISAESRRFPAARCRPYEKTLGQRAWIR